MINMITEDPDENKNINTECLAEIANEYVYTGI